jgi:putative two-component system response regulator
MTDDSRHQILIVDDDATNLLVLKTILAETYRLIFAKRGEEALKRAFETRPDLILLDVMMADLSGIEVCRRLKSDNRTRDIPVIFVTALGDIDDEALGFQVGAVDYIPKPARPPLVRARVRTHLALYDQNRQLEEKVRERTRELWDSRLSIIHRLGKAAEFRDNETGDHVIRMAHYCRLLAERLGWCETDVNLLFHAAPMHDVGKIGIPDAILQKPGPLDAQEWRIMKQHTTIGAEIIGPEDSDLMRLARVIALTHHEKWNGSGYPEGISGEDIPTAGRIVALADVFDALTSERPYKNAWPVDEAFALIQKEAGRHFDPELARIFLEAREAILAIREEWTPAELRTTGMGGK